MPAGLVAAMAEAAADRAVQDPRFRIGANGCLRLGAGSTGSPGLQGCFAKRGPAFALGNTRLSLRLTAWGRAGRLEPVRLGRGSARANRIEYRGHGVREWWRASSLGYEQGFTLRRPPAGRGRIVLHVHASTAPSVRSGVLAWGALRYGKLHVTDADGRVLPARSEERRVGKEC